MEHNKLFDLLDTLFPSIITYDESWGYLNIKGNYGENVLNGLIATSDFLDNIGVSIKIDNDIVTIEDIQLYIENRTQFERWEVNVNKLISNEEPVNYFYKTDKLNHWFSGLSPFSPQNPFHRYSKWKIIVGDLDEPIQGKCFLIVPISEIQQDTFWEKDTIPDKNLVNINVRFIISDDILISPANFIYKTISTSIIVAQLRRLAVISLAASIVSEFISIDKVSIDGAKKMYLKLWDQTDDFSEVLYGNLMSLVEWCYEEKTSTRLKLFYDRITLEIDETKSYITGLNSHLTPSLQQSKQRYNFLILERKDKYISELKDLLKDIRNQSDLYSQKIRNLLNNLLRDVLAALVLVGFTLFTKLSDNIQLDKAALIDYVFYALSIYYVVSIVLQTVIDVADIEISKREMLYWKTTANELLPANEVETRINESLKGRRISLRIGYPIIAIFYIFIAVICAKFPAYFHKATINKVATTENSSAVNQDTLPNSKNKKLDDKIPQHTIKTDSGSSRGK